MFEDYPSERRQDQEDLMLGSELAERANQGDPQQASLGTLTEQYAAARIGGDSEAMADLGAQISNAMLEETAGMKSGDAAGNYDLINEQTQASIGDFAQRMAGEVETAPKEQLLLGPVAEEFEPEEPLATGLEELTEENSPKVPEHPYDNKPAGIARDPRYDNIDFPTTEINVTAAAPTERGDLAAESASVAMPQSTLSPEAYKAVTEQLDKDGLLPPIEHDDPALKAAEAAHRETMGSQNQLSNNAEKHNVDLNLRDVIEKYGFRDGGEIPRVKVDHTKESQSHKLIGARTENGQEILTLQIRVAATKDQPARVETLDTSPAKLLGHLKDSDARMQSGERRKEAAKEQEGLKDGPRDIAINQETIDEFNAEKRDKLRRTLKLEQRIASGKVSWLDHTKIATANFMTGNSANVDPGDVRKRRIAKIIGGAGALVMIAMVGKGLIDHDHVNTAASNFTDHANAAANTAAADTTRTVAETARAFHDTINQGDGITNTIMDYARAHGQDITPEQAYDVFKGTPNSLLDTISNTSPQDVTGGVGFNGPGSANVPQDVIARWNELLNIK